MTKDFYSAFKFKGNETADDYEVHRIQAISFIKDQIKTIERAQVHADEGEDLQLLHARKWEFKRVLEILKRI